MLAKNVEALVESKNFKETKNLERKRKTHGRKTETNKEERENFQ